MTAKQLMNPRFEVIGDYPSSPNRVGAILECPELEDSLKQQWSEYFSRYPAIFRKLNWWDYRTQEQMPKRLTCKAIPNDNSIEEIEEWDMKRLWGWVSKKERTGAGLLSFNPEYGYFPAD